MYPVYMLAASFSSSFKQNRKRTSNHIVSKFCKGFKSKTIFDPAVYGHGFVAGSHAVAVGCGPSPIGTPTTELCRLVQQTVRPQLSWWLDRWYSCVVWWHT
jgi:hypothetical protein